MSNLDHYAAFTNRPIIRASSGTLPDKITVPSIAMNSSDSNSALSRNVGFPDGEGSNVDTRYTADAAGSTRREASHCRTNRSAGLS